jgi:hypothetical protein
MDTISAYYVDTEQKPYDILTHTWEKMYEREEEDVETVVEIMEDPELKAGFLTSMKEYERGEIVDFDDIR